MPYSKYSVLVADDDELCREIISALLEPLGVRLVVAENGRMALDLAWRERFDLILMDVQMPMLGGLEATRQIRAASPNADTWVIGMSADDYPEDHHACRCCGMDDLFKKPIGIDALMDAVRTLLTTRRVPHGGIAG